MAARLKVKGDSIERWLGWNEEALSEFTFTVAKVFGLCRDGAYLDVESAADLVGIIRLLERSGYRTAVLEEAPVAPAPSIPEEVLELLDLSVPRLIDVLAVGEHDPWLQALLSAEEGGKTRKTAVAAIKARMEASNG